MVALAAGGASADAATVQYTTDVSSVIYVELNGAATTTVPASQLNFSVPVTQFNPALGVLNSVTQTIDVDYELVFGTGSSSGGNGYMINAQFSLGGILFSGDGGGAGNGGPAGQSFDLVVPIDYSTTITPPNPAELATIGTGTTPFGFIESTDVAVESFAGSTAQFERDAGTVTLSYNYTAVPEPATAGVIGAAALAVSGRRRRRRSDRSPLPLG